MRRWLDDHIKKLNLVDTMEQPNGFTRLSYSEEEWQSIDVFCSVAEQLGLQVRQDEAGNRIARWDVESDVNHTLPAVTVGSHVDTVTNGGGYDGVAGVLCGLGAIKQLKDEGFEPAFPLEVICFASEESARFGVSTIGSKAMSGILETDALADVRDQDGISVREAVEERGLSWSNITHSERNKDEIKSFVELHIEQGVRVEDANAQFGVATAIACPIRLQVQVEGKMGHTGTTPMGKRQDALVAISPLVSFVSEKAEQLSNESSYPIVATVSTLTVKPNVMNVIPGFVKVGIDIRSVDDELKKKMESLIRDQCENLENQYDVKINVNTLVHNASVSLDQALALKLKRLGEEVGYKSFVMESGAGHDVMNMAKKWPSGLIFIPCRDGLSHHPEEHASLEDLERGVNIITAYLKKEASE